MTTPRLSDGTIVLDELVEEDAEAFASMEDEAMRRVYRALSRDQMSADGARVLIQSWREDWQQADRDRSFAVRRVAGGLVGQVAVRNLSSPVRRHHVRFRLLTPPSSAR